MIAGIVALTAALTACGGDDESADLDAAATTAEETAAAGGEAVSIGGVAGDESAGATAEATAAEPAETAPPGVDEPGRIDLGTIGSDVVIEMQVSMTTDDLQRTVTMISTRAAGLGGGVASSDVDYGTGDENSGPSGYALIVVKVPPTAVDDLIGGLDEIGTVRSLSQSAQDVTEQLVDLDVRIANARESVANVREFMDQTEDLSELVTLEAELTRRQTELEQLEADQRNLADRVALSTITIEVSPTPAVPPAGSEAADDESVSSAFAEGWKAFVAVLYGAALVLAVLTPFLVSGIIVVAIIWIALRRRTPTPASPPESDRSRVGHGAVSERDDVPSPTG